MNYFEGSASGAARWKRKSTVMAASSEVPVTGMTGCAAARLSIPVCYRCIILCSDVDDVLTIPPPPNKKKRKKPQCIPFNKSGDTLELNRQSQMVKIKLRMYRFPSSISISTSKVPRYRCTVRAKHKLLTGVCKNKSVLCNYKCPQKGALKCPFTPISR